MSLKGLGKNIGPGTVHAPSPAAKRAARRAYPGALGFQRAFLKGWYGRLGGLKRDACPYRARLKGYTFAWRAAWLKGWEAAR